MTTKNIQLSIIAAFLFVLNASFYYCFNQIAFVINYSHRTYPVPAFFSDRQAPKAPTFTADLAKLLFPSVISSSVTGIESERIASSNATISTIEHNSINTLTDEQATTATQTIDIKEGEHSKNLTTPAQSVEKLSSAEIAKVNSSPEKTDVPAQNVTPGDDAMAVINIPPAKKVVGHSNSAAANDIPVIRSVSKDASVAGKMVSINGQNSLMVYPTASEWREMFVILNLGPNDRIAPQSIVTPDFDGVVYPSLQKGELELHGTKYKVALIKLKGHSATPAYPYFLSLSSSSSFYIFGDYSDKGKWYIYENDQVTQFSPSTEIHLF